MQRFDEHGNFVNLPPPEVIPEIGDVEQQLPVTVDVTAPEYDVIYDAVENKYIIKRKGESLTSLAHGFV